MRPMLPLGAVLLVLALFVGWRATTRPATPIAAPAPRLTPSAAPPTPSPVATAAARVTRDLLRYEEPEPVAPPPVPIAPPVRSSAPPPVLVPPAQRLVGFVRRRGTLCAALVLPGNVTVVTLAAGESSANYTVLELDDERGVRLRTPDGNELLLPPPR